MLVDRGHESLGETVGRGNFSQISASIIEAPRHFRLDIRRFPNDSPMQQGYTADALFSVDRPIEYPSQYLTLEPGDRVRIEISNIGTLEHSIG